MNNTKEILDDMRKITMLTGEISSVHEQSLKQWPYVALESVQHAEIKYDLTKDLTQETGEGYVHFDVKSALLNEEHPKIKDRCDVLTEWVRDMFWKEIKVIVSLNDTIVYENSTTKEIKDGPKQD